MECKFKTISIFRILKLSFSLVDWCEVPSCWVVVLLLLLGGAAFLLGEVGEGDCSTFWGPFICFDYQERQKMTSPMYSEIYFLVSTIAKTSTIKNKNKVVFLEKNQTL